ncbi:MAG: NifU family protein [Clostridia bacterium]|nr:NifU family protein [Clostridia bacterium]
MKDQIIAALEQIRPFLQRDGGDVEFVDYTADKTVLVRLEGHCAGCPHAQETVKNGIQSILQEQFGAEVASVEAVNKYA